MTTEADTGVGIDGADVWYERLGWAYGLIASDRLYVLRRSSVWLTPRGTPGMPWIGTTGRGDVGIR